MRLLLVLSLALLASCEEEDGKGLQEEVGGDADVEVADDGEAASRDAKQFWPVFHTARVLPASTASLHHHHHHPAAVRRVPLSTFHYAPFAPRYVSHVATANEAAKDEVDLSKGRVADITELSFGPDRRKADELALVESVNKMLAGAQQAAAKARKDSDEKDPTEKAPSEDDKKKEERKEDEVLEASLQVQGRQNLNGQDIFSEDDLSVLPGSPILTNRPNREPVESLAGHGGHRGGGVIGHGHEILPHGGGGHHLHHGHHHVGGHRTHHQQCCLFVFFDGSAYYFDDYLRLLTGPYRLMYGTVNGHPHYVARGCKDPDLYGPNCSYIWNSGYGWIIGIGTYIGQTKGVIYTRNEGPCPTHDRNTRWRYLNSDLHWKDNGNIILECAS